jgi:hypothetical protein
MSQHRNDADVLAAVQHWLVHAVIGLQLCPFAKSVYVKEQIRYVVSRCTEDGDILGELDQELRFLAQADAAVIDTTLLILPDALGDFHEFNDFLTRAERTLKAARLRGVLQIASFHPGYQFADREPDDIENYTNRSPFPILHLLREDSVESAVAAFPEAHRIFEKNQETLRALGPIRWRMLMAGDTGKA